PLRIYNGGQETLTWTASGDAPWFSIVPPSGSVGALTYSEVDVVLDPTALPSQTGEHTGTITVTSNGGESSVVVTFIPIWATGGIVGLYADPAGTDCNFYYSGAGLVSVYVVHTYTDGATALQFSAPIPDCWTNAVFLSDTDVYPVTIGSSQTGKALGYGVCISPMVQATTINYFVQGPPQQTCCIYPVLPDPNVPSGQIEMVDCNNTIRYAVGGYAVLYPDASCMCERGNVKVEESTWGRVKALYAPE
ncbi:MAG: BACON domain-containing protein, partial [Candidatus Latescibacterota bacterium]